MTAPLTLFHTAEANVATFGGLLAELAPDIPVRHQLRADLLQEAQRRGGLTPEIRRRACAAMLDAAGQDSPVVLCTCSTIGGAADDADRLTDRTVIRVDRPMAERAVAAGRRIAIAATVATTIGPTRELLTAVAAAAGLEREISEVLIPDAWALFEHGDQDGYLERIAAALPEIAGDAEVIVLAQASMAGAVERCRPLPVPVLSSPRLGVEAAIASFRAAG
jgi:hypothetical protein